MKNISKRLAAIAASLSLVVIAGGTFTALSNVDLENNVGDAAANAQNAYEEIALSMVENEGAETPADERTDVESPDQSAAQIGIQNETHENSLESRIEMFDANGKEMQLSELNEDAYGGFMAQLNLSSADTQAKLNSAVAVGDVRIVYDDLIAVDSLEVLSEYFTETDVQRITPDIKVKAFESESSFSADAISLNDPYYTGNYQNDLDTIKAAWAWENDIRGQVQNGNTKKTVVAVLDTGLVGTGTSAIKHQDIDYSHVIAGKNYTIESNNSRRAETDTSDLNGHGSFCAGEIFAIQNNGVGVTGIAPDVYIQPYRALNDKGDGYASHIVAAINDAINNKVDIISMSLGVPSIIDGEPITFPQDMLNACQKAVDAGIIVVAAAGNAQTNIPHYPASFDCVIGVSATDKSGEFDDDYSNYGKDEGANTNNVFISAPGTSLVSISHTSATGYRYNTGTSMATPEVAALAALADSLAPSLNQNDFKELLKTTSQKKYYDSSSNRGDGYDYKYGWGLIDCKALLSKLIVPGDEQGKGTSGGVTWYVSDSDAPNAHQLVLAPTNGVSGTLGEINSKSSVPWSSYSSTIKSVFVMGGVSLNSNSDYAFSGLSNATSLDLGNLIVPSSAQCAHIFDGLGSINFLDIGKNWKAVSVAFPSITSSRCGKWSDIAGNAVGATITAGTARTYKLNLGHTVVATSDVAATCTAAGTIGGTHCSVCNSVITAPTTVAKLGHDYKSVVTQPTCIEQGYTTKTCSRCNTSIKENYTNALGHNWDEPIWNWSENCSSATAKFTCKNNIAHTETKTATISQNNTGAAIEYTASVLSPSNVTRTSKVTINTNHTHSWSAGAVVHEPTCTAAGDRIYSCSCGITKIDTAPAKGHSYVAKVTAPTCDVKGYTTYTCSACRNEYTGAETAALGHSWGEPKWTWGSGYASAKAEFTCTRNAAHKQSVNASVTSQKASAYTDYAATASFAGKTYKTTYRLITTQPITSIALSATNFTYDGAVKTPGVTVKAGTTVLTQNTHYTVSYSAGRINAGTYTVTVTGKDAYTGSKSATFTISRANVSSASVSNISSVYDFTGAAVSPTPTVKVANRVLALNKDYTLSYANNKKIGTATLTITGKGNYAGAKSVSYKLAAPSIARTTVTGLNSYQYTGSAIKPAPTVKTQTGATLVNNRDYTLSYKNNKNVGTATVTIKGKGAYKNTSVDKTFQITKASLANATVTGLKNVECTGKAQTQKVTVKLAGKSLKLNTDYTVSYRNNVSVGTAAVVITGKGNYQGSITKTFQITKTSLSKATITKPKTQNFTGGALCPVPTVKLKGVTLKNGVDYTLSFRNNVNAGTATVTVTGKGSFQGSKSTTFKINKANLKSASVSNVVTKKFAGTAVTQNPKVMYAGKQLVYGRDYTISYSNNKKVGAATMTIKGIGNFQGSVKVKFNITK